MGKRRSLSVAIWRAVFCFEREQQKRKKEEEEKKGRKKFIINSPVVTSIPLVSKFSGWPGVMEPHWRNCLSWSICMASGEGGGECGKRARRGERGGGEMKS